MYGILNQGVVVVGTFYRTTYYVVIYSMSNSDSMSVLQLKYDILILRMTSHSTLLLQGLCPLFNNCDVGFHLSIPQSHCNNDSQTDSKPTNLLSI